MEAADQGADTVRQQFWNHRFGEDLEEGEMMEANVDLFDAILLGAVNNQAKIDQMTNRALDPKWPIDRIDPTMRAIFRAAGSELVDTDTPPRVVIDEFVEITKSFFDEDKPAKMVNAVLDKVAREAQPSAFS